MPNADYLLEIESVSQQYGAKRVINDLSMHLRQGNIGCLLGPSGCGKTTVLRCIAGFERVQQGTIRLAGSMVSDITFHQPSELRQVGMVFQDYALFPHLTAGQNIAFGLHGYSASDRQHRVDEMLELIGLKDFARLYPHELSGGQQQRIALARALAPRPKLLLLDEPFSNLDVSLRERLCLDVRDILKREHATAILVTHDQQEAFMVADEIGVMKDGALRQWDTAYNLYHRPSSRFVADFIGKGVFLPGIVLDQDRIEIELGILEGDVNAPCTGGCVVDVLLRPDDIIHDDDSPLRAIVSSKAFRGADIMYSLKLESGAEVLSLVPSHHNHAIGEAIGIRLVTDHVIAFVGDD